jgi:hypothetical protein
MDLGREGMAVVEAFQERNGAKQLCGCTGALMVP